MLMPISGKYPHVTSCGSPVVSPVLLLLVLSIFCIASPAQQSGGVAPSGPQVRLVRSIVGAKGEQRNGSFVMTEPRSTFYVPDDREVIVYFEWESVKGTHHCEGTIRGPNGQFASMSSFDYNATQPRFAGFWKVPLSDGSTAGTWIFESHVDGEAAGQLSFQVIPGAKPSNLPQRQLPTTGEIYKLAVAASNSIEALDSGGKTVKRGSGFLIKEGLIVTSLRVVEGASSVRMRFSDGKEIRTDRIFGWNRAHDWAALAIDGQSPIPLKAAEAKSWSIGDRCFWLDVKPDGSRVIAEGQIVGLDSRPPWGERIDISGQYNRGGLGGPLLNEQGQVIGLLGGTLPETLLAGYGSDTLNSTPDINIDSLGGIAVPVNLLPASLPHSPSSLSELLIKGEMMPLVSNSRIVLFGLLSDGPKAGAKKRLPGERSWKVSFQKGDSSAAAILAFSNSENLKSTATIKLYDIDNRLVGSGKQEKLNIGKGEPSERTWQLPLTSLPVGYYRVDVVVGDTVAWRQFFKLTD
jgi:S1-C subfamily serine protease